MNSIHKTSDALFVTVPADSSDFKLHTSFKGEAAIDCYNSTLTYNYDLVRPKMGYVRIDGVGRQDMEILGLATKVRWDQLSHDEKSKTIDVMTSRGMNLQTTLIITISG